MDVLLTVPNMHTKNRKERGEEAKQIIWITAGRDHGNSKAKSWITAENTSAPPDDSFGSLPEKTSASPNLG